MRTGVLSDANATSFEPLPFVANERHFGLPHIEKTTKRTRHRKVGYRPTPRPRAPYLAHVELAQLMNPLNPKQHIDAFGRQMQAAVAPKPSTTFRGVVEQFRAAHPSYSMMREETAYFLEALGYEPNEPKYGFIDSIGRLQRKRMHDQPLHVLYERVLNKLGNNLTASEIAEIDRVYEEASKHLTIQVKLEEGDGVVEAAPPQLPVEAPHAQAPPDSDDDRDRSPSVGRSAAPSRSLISHLPFLQRVGDDRGKNRFSTSPSPSSPLDRARNFLSRSQERQML